MVESASSYLRQEFPPVEALPEICLILIGHLGFEVFCQNSRDQRLNS